MKMKHLFFSLLVIRNEQKTTFWFCDLIECACRQSREIHLKFTVKSSSQGVTGIMAQCC